MQTLKAHLAQGSIAEAQRIHWAWQIANALADWHRDGFVHGCLHPEIVVLKEAGVELGRLEYAGTRGRNPEPANLPDAPRLHHCPEGAWAYAAPEMRQGKPADPRADVYALGAVLFELITGRSWNPDDGTPTARLESVQKAVSASAIGIHYVLQRCLREAPDERWRSAVEAAAALETMSAAALAPARPKPARWPIILGSIGILALSAAAVITHWPKAAVEEKPAVRFSVPAPSDTIFGNPMAAVAAAQLALSPDGRRLAFVAARPGEPPMLWIRSMDDPAAQIVPETDGASYPFWSPDSARIAFFSHSKLRQVDVLRGGRPSVICDAGAQARGGTWSRTDVILFARTNGPIYRVAAGGGAPEAITRLNAAAGETAHIWPNFLPDGMHFLMTVRSGQEKHRGLFAASLDGPERIRLASSDFSASYSDPGAIVYLDGVVLTGRRFDPKERKWTGPPVRLADRVAASSNGFGAVSASPGMLAYDSGGAFLGRLTWRGHDGSVGDSVGSLSDFVDVQIAPDGARTAIARVNPTTNEPEIRVLPLGEGNPAALPGSSSLEASPVWFPDGSEFVFRSAEAGLMQIYRRSLLGGPAYPMVTAEMQRKLDSEILNVVPNDISPDGSKLLFNRGNSEIGMNLWVMDLSGSRSLAPVTEGNHRRIHGVFSPDGSQIAYASNETGRYEVYLRSADPERKDVWPVSAKGGSEPVWGSGGELFFLAPDGKLMAAKLRQRASGPVVENVESLFDSGASTWVNPYRTRYSFDRRANRFLVNTVNRHSGSSLTVLVNWSDALK